MEFQRVNRSQDTSQSARAPHSEITDRVDAILSQEGNRILELIQDACSQDPTEAATRLSEKLQQASATDLGSLLESISGLFASRPHAPNAASRLLQELQEQVGEIESDSATLKEMLADPSKLKTARKTLDEMTERANDLKAIATGKLNLARLEALPLHFQGLQIREDALAPVDLYITARSALATSIPALGTDHPLSSYLIDIVREHEQSQEVQQARNPAEGPAPGKPAIEYTSKGFEVTFRLPTDLIGQFGMPSGDEVIEYIQTVARQAEELCAKEHLRSGPYNNSISQYSMTNSIGTKGPKIYDPTGEFRGRSSSNSIASDSVVNSIGKFGSDISGSGIRRIFKETAKAESLLKLLYGKWQIVADQS